MHYPIYRPRRMREKEALRAMIRETQLSVKDLIYPLFFCGTWQGPAARDLFHAGKFSTLGR